MECLHQFCLMIVLCIEMGMVTWLIGVGIFSAPAENHQNPKQLMSPGV